ncbi:hypothetical protein KKF92_01275 [Patescibacteria group bacterium]|nr:hypothetical protein [Patescibacteria group bacterium]
MFVKLKQQLSRFLVGKKGKNLPRLPSFIKFSFKNRHAISIQSHQGQIRSIYQQIISEAFYAKTEKPIVQKAFITSAGVLVFYHLELNQQIRVYSLLFETAHPRRLLWKFPRLILNFSNQVEKWRFMRLEKIEGYYQAFWRSPTLGIIIKVYPSYRFTREIELKQSLPQLIKFQHNPMIKPHEKNSWEAFTTFNPAAFYAADKVHILYRAQGHDYVSQIGYATSIDGLTIDTRLAKPIYQPTQHFEGTTLPPGDPYGPFASGGGCGGVEDPRTTIIHDRVYMTYVAYNGWHAPRIALTSILLTDFLNHNFLWERPVLISPPGVIDKSACLFPEKIRGKYAIMHRVFPNILIDYVDNLNFTGSNFLEGEFRIEPRSRDWWDSRKIGAGAPPIRTDEGWLLIYQAVDDKDASEYKVGAMLLDINDPTKILYRSQQPVLLPREDYEKFGFKAGVVYPCGAVVKDGTLFVYYGGADSYVCVAVANLEKFIGELKNTGVNHLDATMLQMSED